MSEENPFAAPAVATVPMNGAMPWFAVSPNKLIVMTMVTFGLYTAYWFERQFRFQKRTNQEKIMPLARAIFSIFFATDLFQRVSAAAVDRALEVRWKVNSLAGLFVGSIIGGRILDRATQDVTEPLLATVLLVVSVVLVFGVALPLARAQETINQVLDRDLPGHERNDTFTVWNWIAIVLGGATIAFAIAEPFV